MILLKILRMAFHAIYWSSQKMSHRILAAVLILGTTTSGALAAPAQLYGKSVIVGWTENRLQTTGRDASPTGITASGQLSIYVSDKGRPFSRLNISVSNRRNQTRSRQIDAVQGDGSVRAISFRGNSMTASMPRGDAGAMMISVAFDSGFGGCSAHVVAGKANGAHATRSTSMFTGTQVEIYSIKTSGESCSIQSGNVFGN
jgi:hypothetical protein